MLIRLSLLLIIFAIATQAIYALDLPNRKLDETSTPGTGEVKCQPSCVQPPPPPPACPPPPPPALPPPPPKKPPSNYCPPPPYLIYLTGPPGGTLYPVDEGFNGAAKTSAVSLLALVGFGFLGLLTFW